MEISTQEVAKTLKLMIEKIAEKETNEITRSILVSANASLTAYILIMEGAKKNG